MKTIILAAAIAATTATGAFAQSGALDVFEPEMTNAMVDFQATASIGNGQAHELGPRLGDGSPVYTNTASNIDTRATRSISINQFDPYADRARLGEGSPNYQGR